MRQPPPRLLKLKLPNKRRRTNAERPFAGLGGRMDWTDGRTLRPNWLDGKSNLDCSVWGENFVLFSFFIFFIPTFHLSFLSFFFGLCLSFVFFFPCIFFVLLLSFSSTFVFFVLVSVCHFRLSLFFSASQSSVKNVFYGFNMHLDCRGINWMNH